MPAIPERDKTEPRLWACPDCKHLSKSVDEFASHLQRHRPVEPASAGSKPCPKGCGRHFKVGVRDDRTPRGDYKAHVLTCRGEAPLVRSLDVDVVVEEESDMAKAKQMARHKSWRCETHDFKTKSPRWWGEHLKKMHVVVKGIPGKPVESAMLKMVESVDLKPTPLMQARAQAAAAQKETASAVRKQGYEEFKFDEEDPRESHLPAARREIQDRIAALRKRVVDLEALDKAIGQVMPS